MKVLQILCLITICSHKLSFAQVQPMQADTFQQNLKMILTKHHIPGGVVAMFSGDEILNIAAAGVKRIEHPDMIQLDDKFHLGSNTKAMTAFVAAALVDSGLIQWNTKFFDLFPEMAKTSNKQYTEVTLEDLLHHRAFIQPYIEDYEFEKIPEVLEGDIIPQRKKWSQWLLEQEPVEIDSANGFTYSNAGYVIATTMLEKVSGKDYETLMNEHLFQPLQINGGFGWPNAVDANQPWGHYTEEGDSTIKALSPDHEYKIGKLLSPAGDIHMSIKDYISFLQNNMNGLNGKDTLLQQKTYQYLHHTNGEHKIYSLGWGVGKIKMGEDKVSVSTHDGSGGTYYCHAFLIPEKDIGLCILFNGGTDEHSAGCKQLRNSILRYVREF